MNNLTQNEITHAAIPSENRVGAWQVVAASVRGSRHEAVGLPCQDACHWHMSAGGLFIAAVCDGLGSAEQSEIGSTIASRVAVEALSTDPSLPTDPHDVSDWESHMTDALRAAVSAVEEEAFRRKVPVCDLATTLILVVATPQTTIAVQVGDGAVVVEDQDGNLIALTHPPVGEYANETDALCSPDLTGIAQGRYWPVPVKNVAIFSDGLQRLALQFPECIPHSAFFSPLFSFVTEARVNPLAQNELSAFLQSARVRSRTDDDTTLLLAHLPES